ncbi:MAG: TspO/MBR family protein [Sphingomonas sp.]
MSEIASKAQLRWAFLRWAVVVVPFILLLGFASASMVPMGANNRWYQALVKPDLTPPDWVFPVAWSALYVMMGLALSIVVYARGARLRGLAILSFAGQLAVNLVWSPIFFGAHQVLNALIIIVVMFVLALATTLLFGRIRSAAAWLMVPYLVWIMFAGVLNFRIHQLNPNAETLVPSASSTQILD